MTDSSKSAAWDACSLAWQKDRSSCRCSAALASLGFSVGMKGSAKTSAGHAVKRELCHATSCRLAHVMHLFNRLEIGAPQH